MKNKLLFSLALVTILSCQQLIAQTNQINFWVNTDRIVAEYPEFSGVIHIDDSYYLFGPVKVGGSIPISLNAPSGTATITLNSIAPNTSLLMTGFEDKNNANIIADTVINNQNPVVLPINQSIAANTLQRFSIRFSFVANGTTYECSLDPKLRATQPTK